MGNANAARVQTREENHTFVSPSLRGILFEIDGRLNHANCWMQIDRDGNNLISETRYYRDSGFTNLAIKRVFTRTELNGKHYITTIATTYYEEDGVTVDSTVTTTVTRNLVATNKEITSCASPFSTTEDAEEY